MFLNVTTLIKFVLLNLVFIMALGSVLTWMERRQSAYIHDRVGPTRADIPMFGHKFTAWGLIHILADAVKSLFKEPFVPGSADPGLFKLAPLIPFVVTMVVMALVPFGPDIRTIDVPFIGNWLVQNYPEYPVIPMQIARLDAGLLVAFAVSSLSIYGVALAGWASNNRYAMLGGLRAAAQAISYEVALGLTVVGTFIVFGSTELAQIVRDQSGGLFWGLPAWGIFVQPFGAMLFLVAGIAESKRTPFDLPEGESEIVGFFLEYSSMAFALFMLSEYVEVAVLASIFTVLFFGGWQLPWIMGESSLYLGFTSVELSSFWIGILGFLVFCTKVFLLSAFQLQIRWTLPRFRYDQLMRLGWKNLLPLALVNIFVTAGLVWVDPTLKLSGYVGLGLVAIFAMVVIAGPKRVPAHAGHDAGHGHGAAHDAHAAHAGHTAHGDAHAPAAAGGDSVHGHAAAMPHPIS